LHTDIADRLISPSSVISISKTQDSIGPICANVSDVARVLQAIATPPVTLPDPECHYLSALSTKFLSDNKIRIGVPRAIFCTPEALEEEHQVIMKAFEQTLEVLKSLGGCIVDPADIPNARQVFERGEPPPEEWRIMYAEFRVCQLQSTLLYFPSLFPFS
jgi:amidase